MSGPRCTLILIFVELDLTKLIKKVWQKTWKDFNPLILWTFGYILLFFKTINASCDLGRPWNSHDIILANFKLQPCSFEIEQTPLYEVKWVLFRWLFGYIKILPSCCQSDMFEPLIRPFKWSTAWSSISKDIRNTSSQTFGYPTLLDKVGLFCNFWLWLVVILMPLKIKLHAVLHLKGLINA